jgi:DNA processing protein
MDLLTAVAASMLPATRSSVAVAFKDLHLTSSSTSGFLELLWCASGRRDPLSPSVVAEIVDAAGVALGVACKADIAAVPLFDVTYPPLLACTADPPPVLWLRGDRTLLERPAVAIVGSRAASPYALQVGTRLGADLAQRGVVVVSGLARGVDSAAHRGCLDSGGGTIAVQGCGLDRVYPAEHAGLADSISQTGLLAAELAPGAPPLPEHFPLRNRIISGISLGVVVVEASEKSGSLITARYALEQGRDVMAVPGSILSGRNGGSHALLKDGARVVETADDILQELGWSSAPRLNDTAKSLTTDPLLVQMDPGEPYGLEELAARSGLPGPSLLAALTALELAGLIVATGGRFIRRP